MIEILTCIQAIFLACAIFCMAASYQARNKYDKLYKYDAVAVAFLPFSNLFYLFHILLR